MKIRTTTREGSVRSNAPPTKTVSVKMRAAKSLDLAREHLLKAQRELEGLPSDPHDARMRASSLVSDLDDLAMNVLRRSW